jgi:TrmH family RNA methyltransferase
VLRAGMGAHFMLDIHEQADLVSTAKAFKGQVIATSRGASRSLYACDLTGSVALLFGNEGNGLSRSLRGAAHAEVSIPMPGKLESLNVAAAVAVCLYERVRQRQRTGKS